MEFIDTHCHLQFDKLAQNIEKVIKDAEHAGVTKLICVGTTVADSQKAIQIANSHNNIWASIGWHPHGAAHYHTLPDDSWEQMDVSAKESKVVATGECGLDYHYDNVDPAEQEIILRFQIEMLAIKYNLPLIFHVRDAWKDFWRIFDSYKNLRGVVHSFSAHPLQLEQALSRGLYVALNGIMTFTSDEQQIQAAKQVPKDKLLLETDAPFLAPKPFRGKTCEPKHIRNTAEFLAELRKENIAELADYTTKNARELFGI